MARKKDIINYYPLTMVGGFFEEDYVEDFQKAYDTTGECYRLPVYLEKFFKNFDYSKHPDYLQNIMCLHNVNMNFNKDEEYEGEGFYIGVPLLLAPEHLSVKRVAIDVRELMIDMKLIDKKAHPDSIVTISKVIKEIIYA